MEVRYQALVNLGRGWFPFGEEHVLLEAALADAAIWHQYTANTEPLQAKVATRIEFIDRRGSAVIDVEPFPEFGEVRMQKVDMALDIPVDAIPDLIAELARVYTDFRIIDDPIR